MNEKVTSQLHLPERSLHQRVTEPEGSRGEFVVHVGVVVGVVIEAVTVAQNIDPERLHEVLSC